MKDQDLGAETTQNQPGRKQAHSSISGHFISSSPETTPERNLFSSLLFLRFIYFKIILWMRPVYYTYLWIFWRLKKKICGLEMQLSLVEEREGDLGSSNSSNLGQCPRLCLLMCMRWRQWGERNRARGSSNCTKSPSGGQSVYRSSWGVSLEEDMLNTKQIWTKALRVAMKCG